jgi:hypothetical protein
MTTILNMVIQPNCQSQQLLAFTVIAFETEGDHRDITPRESLPPVVF